METFHENIVENVKVPAFMMNTNIRENLMSILRIKEGTCTSRGCIVRITSLDNVPEAILYPFDSDAFFTVHYTCEVFKPCVGNVYNGIVYKSYDEGLLIDVEGYPNIRILTAQSSSEKPNVGQRVDVKIQDIVFKNDSFTGIGCLVGCAVGCVVEPSHEEL